MGPILFRAFLGTNQFIHVNFTTLPFMHHGNNSQIWTHIFKGGLLGVDGCVYFDGGSSGSLDFVAFKIFIIGPILSWTTVICVRISNNVVLLTFHISA